ncbi:hypothetical protein [Blastomonas aquatica]|uniref:hypothetical protein n=1 Tax=Blastomonas aquatica TaxID=1510276 RepID=UPI003616E01D
MRKFALPSHWAFWAPKPDLQPIIIPPLKLRELRKWPGDTWVRESENLDPEQRLTTPRSHPEYSDRFFAGIAMGGTRLEVRTSAIQQSSSDDQNRLI